MRNFHRLFRFFDPMVVQSRFLYTNLSEVRFGYLMLKKTRSFCLCRAINFVAFAWLNPQVSELYNKIDLTRES